MNPDDSRVARFTNISDATFSHPFGGVPYSFEAGESKILPFALAEHLAKHLAYSMRLKGDKSARQYNPADPTGGHGAVLWNDDEIKQDMEKIISNVYEEERAAPKTEMELMREQIERLNAIVIKQEETPGDVVTETTDELVEADPTIYKDKAEVIAELTKRDIKFDARAKKSELEKLLD